MAEKKQFPSPEFQADWLDYLAEEMHSLSFTEGHNNYYAFAEGMVFAAWLLRKQPLILNADTLHQRFLKDVKSAPPD